MVGISSLCFPDSSDKELDAFPTMAFLSLLSVGGLGAERIVGGAEEAGRLCMPSSCLLRKSLRTCLKTPTSSQGGISLWAKRSWSLDKAQYKKISKILKQYHRSTVITVVLTFSSTA